MGEATPVLVIMSGKFVPPTQARTHTLQTGTGWSLGPLEAPWSLEASISPRWAQQADPLASTFLNHARQVAGKGERKSVGPTFCHGLTRTGRGRRLGQGGR